MREIPLSQGLVALVDDEDFEFLNQWKWFARKVTGSKTHYAARNVIVAPGVRRTVLMHRQLCPQIGEWLSDHENRNGLDNQKANLRYAKQAQNLINREHARTVAPLRGVHQLRNLSWQARIQLDGKSHSLGAYPTAEAAAKAYDAKAREIHGEFAVLNFPD